jgi:hypothetical protein
MPIKFSFKKLPVDEGGKAYDSLEDFQAAMLSKVLGIKEEDPLLISSLADIVSHKAEVIEILELNMDARPTARGVKKPRKPKNESPELLPAGKP